MKLACLLLVVAACKPFAPPPMIAMHADTSAAPPDSTTLVLIAGFAGTVLGGGGWGIAVRGEHQVTARTALGLELTGGWGDEATRKGEPRIERTLYAIRAFGRFTPRTHDWVAATYGAGLGLLDTGLVTLHLHGGAAVSYVNDVVSPVLQVGLATSLVLRRGRPFGDVSVDSRPLFTSEPTINPGPPAREGALPVSDVFLCVDAGLVGSLDSNRPSLDVGFASAWRAREAVVSLSAADAQRLGD